MAKFSCVVVLILFAIGGVLSGPRRHYSRRNYDDDYVPVPRSSGYGRIGLSALTAFANPLFGLGLQGHGGHIHGNHHDNQHDKDRNNFWSYPEPHRTQDYYHQLGSSEEYGSYGDHHGHRHRHHGNGYGHGHSNRYHSHNYDHSGEYDDYY